MINYMNVFGNSQIIMDSEVNLSKCQIGHCSEQATSLWRKHKIILCTCCAIASHHNCKLKVKKEESFICKGKDILNSLIKRMKIFGEVYKIEKTYSGFNEDLDDTSTKVNNFLSK